MEHEVIDNFLDAESFSRIKEVMLSNNFPWFYQSEVTMMNVDGDNSNFYFTHKFYGDYIVNSQYWPIVVPLVNKINPNALIRVKGNLYPRAPVGKTSNLPHTDYKTLNKAAVFYINTNDGPTVLDDGTEIFPVENRILFFNGNELHTSNHCTDQKIRVTINFNYL